MNNGSRAIEISSGKEVTIIHIEYSGTSEPLWIVQYEDGSIKKLLESNCNLIKEVEVSKYEFVKAMSESELNKRIKTTGSKEFKKALEAELSTRSGVIEGRLVEAPTEVVEEVSEEVDTNVPEEVEEAPTEVEEAPKATPAKRGRAKASK